jgi:hypothetical protein
MFYNYNHSLYSPCLITTIIHCNRVYNQMSSIVDIFIATKTNHKDKICSFKTSCVAAQHIICKHSEHGQINTRRQPIICIATYFIFMICFRRYEYVYNTAHLIVNNYQSSEGRRVRIEPTDFIM